MKSIFSVMCVLGFAAIMFSQSLETRYSSYGEMVITHLHNASFPDTARANGHTYDNKFYSAEDHYRDSTVAVFIPKGFNPDEPVNIVIHFHGWGNNVDSTFARYSVVSQFVNSKVNAIMVVPEGPKNSPDSYGGKLEYENGFKNFINELIDSLYSKGKINTHNIGKIILSGHSGGYRVMSYILMRGGLTNYIKEVYLFDALYAEKEKFIYWFDHYNGKLIDIFTQNGGTKTESEKLMADLKGWNIPYVFANEADMTSFDLANNKLIFIYSDLKHAQVFAFRNEFQNYLSASCLDKIK